MTVSRQTAEAIETIINAKSLAVVGVSSNPEKEGFMTLETIIKGGYEGRLYPVNPKGGRILDKQVYTSLAQIPDQLDAVVIIVRASFVPGLIEEAAAKGARGAIILSGGFREAGRQDLEDEVKAAAQKTGLRIMGPNIQGITYLPNKLCAMMFPALSVQGPLAIVSQSGSITAALSEWAAREGFGLSAAINLGNQADLCESDYLDFFADDNQTGAIVLYLEGIKNGPQFLDSLKRAALKKPIAVLKTGRTPSGAKAAASHTGSLAGDYAVFAAACRQCGAYPAASLTELYDAAKGMAGIKPPQGNRLLIVSTSGGVCGISADEAESRGLVVPPLPSGLKEELEDLDLFSPLAHLANPMDLVDLFSSHFLEAARRADARDAADTILIFYGDPVPGGDEVILTLNDQAKASLALGYLGGGEEELKSRVSLQRQGIPVFPSPDRALSGIAAATWRADFLRKRNAVQEDM
ncbi:MAG: CoA-binding protein [Deltaproteobacteria bacterium]|nr:CoA-binding protein [Deltaproteobacteria bacterium]